MTTGTYLNRCVLIKSLLNANESYLHDSVFVLDYSLRGCTGLVPQLRNFLDLRNLRHLRGSTRVVPQLRIKQESCSKRKLIRSFGNKEIMPQK